MNYQKIFKKSLLPSLVSALVLPLCAQGAYGATTLEEIVVTARKRQESIQDVPVAVTAITPGQLERGSIRNVVDVAKLVPNVELHQTSQGSHSLSPSIRGLSYDDIEKSIESTIGVAIDGVFMASNSGAIFDFFDVESVEVLRGPQGTLFGRNTIGGVINVQRTEPTGEWGGKVETTFGDDSLADLKGILNMPLGDKGGIKIAVKDVQSKSFLYNVTNNTRPDNRDSQTASISVKYNFTDSTSALLTYDDYDHNTTAVDIINTTTPAGALCAGTPAQNCATVSSDISKASGYTTSVQKNPLLATLEGENVTLKITHQGEGFELKYIMGTMEYDELAALGSWGTNGVMFPVKRDQTFEQESHELQYISDLDGPMNFVVGAYSMTADSYITSGPIQNFTADHSLEASAFFGEMTYDLNDIWSITAGARYTEEDKDLYSRSWAILDSANRVADNVAAATNTGKPTFSDDNTSYRVVLQREFDKGMMYASLATGFRSGGFFNRGSNAAELLPYQSEEVESFEIGMRSNPTDNSQLNITYFSTDYTDKQVQVIVPGDDPVCGKGTAENGVTCSFTRNAGQVSMDGIEIEAALMPTEALTLRAAIGTFDGGYDEYDYDGVDISDKAFLMYAPELTASLVAEHTSEVAGGSLTVTGSFSYKDEVYTQAAWATYNAATGPEVVIDSYETFDLSATYLKDMGNGTLKVMVYGTDIFEEDGRINRRYDAGSFSWAELAPGRQFGLTLGYEF
ncbi:TonB-dependent receptor [Porticoccaceae bacterium]|nr:TonB-dependent receptor [Porticoccaceae bacterium]MDB4077271.1 TonB-dependent receptor [Porticoccaceae bacterium]MDB9952269.1 TonB-dependent receptor [Porticoccaceae bacterium]